MAFRPRRQARRQKLLDAGFLKFEAFALSRFTQTSQPFYRAMIKERKALVKQAKKQGVNKADFRRIWVKTALYEKDGLLITRQTKTRTGLVGTPDPWALLRKFRQESDDEGEYREDRKKKKRDTRGIRIQKGDIASQKRRRREREKAKRER